MAAFNDSDGYAFLSYVREDEVVVDRLQSVLEAAGIRVWRDTKDLWPGEDWEARIREAIRDNALVFIACFSDHASQRSATYQNREIRIAIEQLQLRRPDQPWLIPVRLSDCPVPGYDIGGGRTLDSIQRVDLFDDRWDQGSARLVAAVVRIQASLDLQVRQANVGSEPASSLANDLPGGAMSSRPLPVLWVMDVSGSMAGTKIHELNQAMHHTIAALRDIENDSPNIAIETRVLAFSSGAKWTTPSRQPLRSFEWTDLAAGGVTDLGAAMRAVAAELTGANMSDRSLPPIVILVSDGQPTDDFSSGLEALMSERWGAVAVRVAIAIGEDVDVDVLRRFANPEIEPLTARNPQVLASHFRWIATALTTSVTSGHVSEDERDIPSPPTAEPDIDDVW